MEIVRCREQSTNESAREDIFAAKARAVLRRMDNDKLEARMSSQQVVADPRRSTRAQYRQLSEDLQTFQRSAASSNSSLGSDRFRRKSGVRPCKPQEVEVHSR